MTSRAPALGLSCARAVLFALALSGCAAGHGPVARLVEGRPIDDTWISADAYASYLAGMLHEQRGELAEAAAQYERALSFDDRSPELWTRLGAVRCQTHPATLTDAFDRAEALSPSYGPLWLERARCRASLGQIAPALEAGHRAARGLPEQPEVSLLLAGLLERAGRPDEAVLVLRGLVARYPEYKDGWRELEATALAADQTALAAYARSRHRDLSERRNTRSREAPEADYDRALEGALAEGDLPRARALATRARLSSGELALRAAALGAHDLARAQAELVLGADPSNADARVAALVAADLEGDNERFARLLSTWQATEELAPLGARLMFELLERRAGTEAGDAFARGYGLGEDPSR